MKYSGTLTADTLIDEAFLNFVSVTERRDGKIAFTVNDDFAAAVAEEISKSFKARNAHAEIKGEYETFMIYPNKIFKFSLKDEATRQKALDYAKSLGL